MIADRTMSRGSKWRHQAFTTPHATICEAVVLRPAQGCSEATPSNNKKVEPDVAIHRAKEGIKGDKKRCK
jgi:hypothetical protein